MKSFDEMYSVRRIPCKDAKEYIVAKHYSHGCHNAPSPCYGMFDMVGGEGLIGVLMFATPCSENVRASIWGYEHRDMVTELHRLHIMDVTPKNAESWFISKCLKLLIQDKPNIRGVISFADETQGHRGTIYQASNFWFIGKTSSSTFYLDANGRLHHPRQCGVNVTKEYAEARGWKPVRRLAKNRYLYILSTSKSEKRRLIRECRYDLLGSKWCPGCGRQMDKDNYYDVCDNCLDKE